VAWLLQPLFAICEILEFRSVTIFRGPASPYCEAHRREVEAGLRQLPGAFCFERFGEATFLTYTMPGPEVKPTRRALHIGLFAATVLTTLLAGADVGLGPFLKALTQALAGHGGGLTVGEVFAFLLTKGAPFSISILLIVGVHESGHYFMARRYGMLATPPFFLPVPVGPIGTFGAVIKIRSPILHRRALLDMGMAGPFAGLIVALPILIYGLSHSTLVPLAELRDKVGVLFGDSLLTWGLERMLFGPIPQGMAVNWLGNPYAWAGWVGLLVAALNLMPVGQLDGGHIAYVLLGRRQLRVAQFMFGLLVALDVSALITRGQVNWVVWCALLLFFLKLAHPPLILGDLPVGPVRRALGWLALAIFVLVFLPLPVIVLS
jgi:hypothetical protein